MSKIQHTKSFKDICTNHALDNEDLQAIADDAGIAKSIVDTMFVGTAVERKHAQKVLEALSDYTGETYTLETVDVPVIDEENIHE